METKKFIHFELKADTSKENTIVGYGSVSGNVDRGNDVVMPGAFAKSIASGKLPKMLWQHDPHTVIGKWDSIVEDEKGLRIEGKLAATPKGQEVLELIKMGAIDGLSIGYSTVDTEYAQGVRLIKEADLWEISIVTFPMNEEAVIDAVKAANITKKELERFLTGAGLSRSVAKGLIAKGYEGITQNALRDAENDESDINNNDLEAKHIEDTKMLDEIRELLNRRVDILK